MKYEVRKGGHVYMVTDSFRYPLDVEASIQAGGYDIYLDGKRLKKVRPIKDGSR